jgi:hypothetical protein
VPGAPAKLLRGSAQKKPQRVKQRDLGAKRFRKSWQKDVGQKDRDTEKTRSSLFGSYFFALHFFAQVFAALKRDGLAKRCACAERWERELAKRFGGKKITPDPNAHFQVPIFLPHIFLPALYSYPSFFA